MIRGLLMTTTLHINFCPHMPVCQFHTNANAVSALNYNLGRSNFGQMFDYLIIYIYIYIYCIIWDWFAALQTFFSNPPVMMIRRNKKFWPSNGKPCWSFVLMFIWCLWKSQNICTINIFLTGNCVIYYRTMREWENES